MVKSLTFLICSQVPKLSPVWGEFNDCEKYCHLIILKIIWNNFCHDNKSYLE